MMKIKEKLGNLLGSETEDLDLELAEIPESFRKRKKPGIEEALQKEEEMKKLSGEIIEQLEDSLDEIKDFKDDEDLQVVEDVAQSFYNRRKHLIEDLELSEDLESHVDDFKDFVDSFNDVSRKEGVVMKRIEKQSGELQSSIQSMIDHSEDLQEFRDNGYRPVLKLQEAKERAGEIQDLRDEIEHTVEEIKSLKSSDKEEELEDLKTELAEVKESDEMEEKENLKEKKKSLEEEKEEKISSINKDLSKIERGLKKAVYEIRNSDTEFSGDVECLEELIDHDFRGNIEAAGRLDEVQEIIEENSLLDERQLEKFKKGAENLSSLEERLKEAGELEEKIQDVDEELESFEIDQEKEELETEIKELESDIEDRKEKISELEDKKESLQEELERKISEFEDDLSRELDANVSIRK